MKSLVFKTEDAFFICSQVQDQDPEQYAVKLVVNIRNMNAQRNQDQEHCRDKPLHRHREQKTQAAVPGKKIIPEQATDGHTINSEGVKEQLQHPHTFIPKKITVYEVKTDQL